MSVDCPACVSQAELRVCCGKRALVLRSFVRLSIVLYGERSPAEKSIGSIITYDLSRKPDLLIVMGTTLKIPGFKRLVVDMSREVRKNGGLAIFVNREKNGAATWKKVFDYQVIGSTDDYVDRLLKRWKQTRPTDSQKQATFNDPFTVTKPSQVVVSKPVQPVPPMTPSASSTRTPLRDPNISLVVPGPGTPRPLPLNEPTYRAWTGFWKHLPNVDRPDRPDRPGPSKNKNKEPLATLTMTMLTSTNSARLDTHEWTRQAIHPRRPFECLLYVYPNRLRHRRGNCCRGRLGGLWRDESSGRKVLRLRSAL